MRTREEREEGGARIRGGAGRGEINKETRHEVEGGREGTGSDGI